MVSNHSTTKGMTAIHYAQSFKSPIGRLYLTASDTGLRSLRFDTPDLKTYQERDNEILQRTKQQLMEYFNQERKHFDLPLEPIGTPFQLLVWAALARIPYGKTVSYKQQAAMLQNPKAVRAVGTANSRNPIAIILPCHRVIASSGALSGYAGGLDIKKALLKLEGLEMSLA